MSAPLFNRIWSMPSGDTFSIPVIAGFVKRWITGRENTIDPFARNSRLAKFTNDLNPKTAADFHMQAAEFLAMLNRESVSADAIIFDPPYSPRQISECYKEAGLTAGMSDTQNAKLYREVKQAAHKLTRHGSIVLSFGWNSCGMGISLGYQVREILLVCHGSAHNDTICIAEERILGKQCEFSEIEKAHRPE